MFALVALSVSLAIDRSGADSSFIKIIDDSTMRDTIKKEKRAFVMFHADHQRLSDVAYSYYVSIARKYREAASFFVVPASMGADVARTYSVTGQPSLLHFRMGTKMGTEFGLYSKEGIERFVVNWTKPSCTEVTFREDATEDAIWSSFSSVLPDRTLAVVFFGDNTTRFGRSALSLSEELGTFFPFVQVTDESVAKKAGVRYPSLVMVRFEDSQRFEYLGESDTDEMFIWAQHNAIPSFRNLETAGLFSPDGVAMRSAIAFMNASDADHADAVFPVIGKRASENRWIRFHYADIEEHRATAKLFGVTKLPQIVYVAANYTQCLYNTAEIEDEETFTAFAEEKLALESLATPVQMYGGLRYVTEYSFDKMAEEGPFFTLFTSAFCAKCKPMKMATIDAARTVIKSGGKTNWGFWDVTTATPSFQSNISLSIPSVWYFPNGNVTEGVPYMGPQNFLSIVEWAHGQNPDEFDIDPIMVKELGGGFDDI